MIPTIKQNPTGLHARYKITKADGSPIKDDAEYFVLRLDNSGSDKEHVRACQLAALEYANRIEHHLPNLAKDLQKRYGHPNGHLCPSCESQDIHHYAGYAQSERMKYKCRDCYEEWFSDYRY